MSDPVIGLIMLGLIVIAIMMGFPTAFTLMGMGIVFGYIAFWNPALPFHENRIFDLMVQRTYGVMMNDTLLSIPLFVFMGYVIERAALVDRMFYSVQLAFRRVPASLAVTTLLICAFWGIASGIVGAVVVLMGVIAMRPMLSAGYDVRLASGVITAGGTLGILIPPSVMIIVYAAIAGQSVVKLYAAAMLPGFFLTFLYLIYIIGWALISPKIAPKLPPEKYRLDVPEWLKRLERGPRRRVFVGLIHAAFQPSLLKDVRLKGGRPVTLVFIWKNLLGGLVPVLLLFLCFATAWWYVLIYSAAPDTEKAAVAQPKASLGAPVKPVAAADEAPQELGVAQAADTPVAATSDMPEELGRPETAIKTSAGEVPESFKMWFWITAALSFFGLGIYYWRMDGEGLEILKLLQISVVPLGVLTVVVLVVILLGITTATESAAVGALGAVYLVAIAKQMRVTLWGSLVGAIVGVVLGSLRGDTRTLIVAATLGAVFGGSAAGCFVDFFKGRKIVDVLKQSTFLTAKTTAMVCWLFIGSALFSAVFALHGGQSIIANWVISLNMTPLQFMLLAQVIIFVLGWPLEWTEIIVIFVPIFLPLLDHFQVDPLLFGTMVAVNLQAAFLSPPVAMSAFYLKGVSPPHVTLNQIFAGMMPYMIIVLLCLAIMYVWPGMTLWLPNFLYGK
jgi:TRAP-type mannitol/chloroaromatic compound transport system permease large subunit